MYSYTTQWSPHITALIALIFLENFNSACLPLKLTSNLYRFCISKLRRAGVKRRLQSKIPTIITTTASKGTTALETKMQSESHNSCHSRHWNFNMLLDIHNIISNYSDSQNYEITTKTNVSLRKVITWVLQLAANNANIVDMLPCCTCMRQV